MDNEISPFTIGESGHIHMAWFEVAKMEDGTIIMCPEGCRRLLKKNGEVLKWNKENQLWEIYK